METHGYRCILFSSRMQDMFVINFQNWNETKFRGSQSDQNRWFKKIRGNYISLELWFSKYSKVLKKERIQNSVS